MNVCEVRHLCKNYPAFSLSDVSFSLFPGTITGFIGSNGAGKTTTIKSIMGLVHPDAGEVSFFGLDRTENERAIRERIGFSTGAVNYYPKKKLGNIARITKTFYENWDEAAYRRYLTLFSLDENKAACELSAGMQVKVNLLFALSHHAEILILDEPTSGLDPFSRDEVCDIFSLLKNEGTAIFFSTHITTDLEKCADRILYIRGGRIAADDTKEGFRAKNSLSGETLEESILRLEREARK